MYRKILAVFSVPPLLWQMVVMHLPGTTGYALRNRFWRKRLRKLGRSTRIGTNVSFENPQYIEIGDNCWIDDNVIILAGPDESDREKVTRANASYPGSPGVVHIGSNIHIGAGALISGISAGVFISDDCCVTAHCRIFAFSHHYRSERDPGNMRMSFDSQAPADRQCLVEGPVFLGRNTAVAVGSTLLPGVSIAENSFVAINSVVRSGAFEPNSLIRGDPASVVGRRFESHE